MPVFEPSVISAVGAGISALCALGSIYLYRRQGKGFIWTKENNVNLTVFADGRINLILSVHIHNLGTGTLRFLEMKSKKVYLKTGVIEGYEMDMDEAYFPEGVLIVKYSSPIYTDLKGENGSILKTQFHIEQVSEEKPVIDDAALSKAVNQKLEDIGEVIIIIKCKYKDGSWLGLGAKETTISLSIHGVEITYLSKERRKELDKLFFF